MIAGTCPLCFAHANLCMSHIIPEWAYKRLARITEQRGQGQPVRMSEGVSRFDSKQLYERMLCERCERRLSDWEGVACRTLVQEDLSFPAIARQTWDEGARARVVRFSDDEHAAMTLFASSIVWRASQSKSCANVRLGARLHEEFRSHILGSSPFPSDALLFIELMDLEGVAKVSGADHRIGLPRSNRDRGVFRGTFIHTFDLFGMHVCLWAGGNIGRVDKSCCFSRAGLAYVTDGSGHVAAQMRAFGSGHRTGSFAKWKP